MRSSDEIQADIKTVSAKLREIHGYLGRMTLVVQTGRDGKELSSERFELMTKLDALKVERTAAITAEFRARPRRHGEE